MANPTDPIEEAERAGIDIRQLEANLALSYTERAIQHQKALDRMLELERAQRELGERAQLSAAPTPSTDDDPS
jgi:hypothetical protein